MLDRMEDPVTNASASESGASWPRDLIDASPPSHGACVVRFAPILSSEPHLAVSLFHQVVIGQDVAWQQHLLTMNFDTEAEARHATEWIGRHQKEAASACRIGTPAALDDFESWMRIRIMDERQQEDALEAEALRLQHEETERATRIASFLVDGNGQFGVDLRRPGAKTGFWRINFRERWERERFRDWFRNQRSRYDEFAAFLDGNDAVALERLVLREMLDTERRVKAAGLSAGGRRPLRFWRGE